METLDVTVYWGQDKSLVLAKLSLTNISSKSKVILSVHIHRDASTHVTLQDKTNSNASDAQNGQLGGKITLNNDNFYLQTYRLDEFEWPLIKV